MWQRKGQKGKWSGFIGGRFYKTNLGKQLVKSPRQACTGRETFGKVIKVQLGQNVVFPLLPTVFGYLITGAAVGKGWATMTGLIWAHNKLDYFYAANLHELLREVYILFTASSTHPKLMLTHTNNIGKQNEVQRQAEEENDGRKLKKWCLSKDNYETWRRSHVKNEANNRNSFA